VQEEIIYIFVGIILALGIMAQAFVFDWLNVGSPYIQNWSSSGGAFLCLLLDTLAFIIICLWWEWQEDSGKRHMKNG